MIFKIVRRISPPLLALHPKFPLLNRNCSCKSNSTEKYETIYKLPYIRHISAYNRLKIYHVAGTLISIPISIVLASEGIVDPNLPLVTSVLGLSIGAFLFTSSIMTDKLIGFVYMNEKQDSVKVAYTNFWGKRKEEIVPIKDIIPFSEIPSRLYTDNLYKPFLRYSGGKALKINLYLGQVMQKDKFDKVFIM